MVPTCSPAIYHHSDFDLDADALETFFRVEDRLVLAVKGIVHTAAPCSVKSRWVLCETCDDSDTAFVTSALVTDALDSYEYADKHDLGFVRDITVACLRGTDIPARAVPVAV